MKTNYSIYNLETPSFRQAKGLSKCWMAYAKHYSNDYIFEIGYNSKSGIIYIALENNITICSKEGRNVKFLVTDFENGEEYKFKNHLKAEEKLEELSELYS